VKNKEKEPIINRLRYETNLSILKMDIKNRVTDTIVNNKTNPNMLEKTLDLISLSFPAEAISLIPTVETPINENKEKYIIILFEKSTRPMASTPNVRAT
jgi:hypothetical protein